MNDYKVYDSKGLYADYGEYLEDPTIGSIEDRLVVINEYHKDITKLLSNNIAKIERERKYANDTFDKVKRLLTRLMYMDYQPSYVSIGINHDIHLEFFSEANNMLEVKILANHVILGNNDENCEIYISNSDVKKRGFYEYIDYNEEYAIEKIKEYYRINGKKEDQ